jgi:hypothetical protein
VGWVLCCVSLWCLIQAEWNFEYEGDELHGSSTEWRNDIVSELAICMCISTTHPGVFSNSSVKHQLLIATSIAGKRLPILNKKRIDPTAHRV